MEKDLKIYSKELHKPIVKKFERRSVKIMNSNDLWSADLVDMRNIKENNEGITFILNIIDIHSRYAFSYPIMTKHAENILTCFKEAVKINGYPLKLWVDEGKEFYNKQFKNWCKEHNIIMYSTHTGLKGVFIERFNRTMKEAFYKMFSEKQRLSYLKFIPEFIEKYNNTVHRTTDMTPHDIYISGKKSHEDLGQEINDKKAKLHIGDYVRITQDKGVFGKGYTARWTPEVFKIKSLSSSIKPTTYKICDLLDEDVGGTYYEQELQKTTIPKFKIIGSVKDERITDGKKEYLVGYHGYRAKKFDEWISEDKYKNFIKNIEKIDNSP